MRELLDNVQYAPTRSRFKIYLIDEVHMLSKHSFNALLKTLEEPPPHIKFLLATTDPQKVPVTVLSRCLQFNLKRMSKAQILSQLLYLTEQEAIAADESALVQLASAADGSMRDALSLLDQAIGYGAGQVRDDTVESMLGSISRDYLLRLLDALSLQQAAGLINEARQVIDHNPDYQRVCAEMISLLQQIALYQSDPKLIIDDEPGAETLRKYSECWSPDEIQLYYQIMLQGRQDLLICPDEAAGFEMLMLRLIAFSPQPARVDTSEEVKKKPEVIVTGAINGNVKRDAGVTQQKRQPNPPALTVPQSVAPEFTGSVAVLPKGAASLNSESAQAEPGHAKSDEAKPDEAKPDEAKPDEAKPEAGAAGYGFEAETGMDWSMLAYKLGLTGIAQELVANSQLQSYADKRIVLQLPGELYELVNDLTRAEILQALQQKLGVSLRLELIAAAGLSGETPLQAKQQREHDERVSAIAAIRDDEMVKKLQHVFDAELDEASVVKIDSNG
jgi:DNA polymerase-3 subunit gamma/tau